MDVMDGEAPDFEDEEYRYWNLDEETALRCRVSQLGLDNE